MIIAVLSEYVATEADPFYGGVDSRIIHLCKELSKRNEVHVFSSLQKGSEGVENYGNIIIHRIGKSRPFVQRGHYLSRLDFNKKSSKEIAKVDPDVIEANGFVSYAGGIDCRKALKTPAMVTVHEVWQGEWVRNMGVVNGIVGNFLERSNLRKPFDKYIAVSEFTKNKLNQLGVSPDKVCVIKNGVDKTTFEKVSVDGKFDAPTIVVVCRLVSYKKVDLLIRAIAMLKAELPDIRLLIIGKGPEEQNLKQLASDLSVNDHVTFFGKVADTDRFVELLKRSHVLALSSIVEGFGMVVIEAMAAGIPYVASDITPIREVTKGGVGGYLFKPMDVVDLADKLRESLQRQDEGRSSNISRILEEYDWKNLALVYEKEAKQLSEHWGGL